MLSASKESLLKSVSSAAVAHAILTYSMVVRMCESEYVTSMLVGRDFNIIRRPEEKNNVRYNAQSPTMLNATIECLDLTEIVLSGWQYICASHRANPTNEKSAEISFSFSACYD